MREARPYRRQSLAPLHPRRRSRRSHRLRRAKRGVARLCSNSHLTHSKGKHQRTVLTAVGPIPVRRTYFSCDTCRQGDFAADPILGVDGYVTRSACRIAVFLGVRQSFKKAERALLETVGWELDDNTIRKLTHAVAKEANANREQRTTAETFAKAAGEPELQIDAGKVNTTDGWRDVKVGVFAKRERGEPSTPADWAEREAPAPTVRSVIAAVEEAGDFGERLAAEAKRLELNNPEELSVLGDGAPWIWNLADRHFPGADQLLDFWHGVEHIGDAAKAVHGQASEQQKEQAKAATKQGKQKLLEDGYWGVTEWVGELTGALAAGGDGAALGDTLNYFAGHQERLHYALRLRRGQTIGSGLVEGSIRQLLNLRMKQTKACWKVEHVGPFVELAALAAGPEWQAFWEGN